MHYIITNSNRKENIMENLMSSDIAVFVSAALCTFPMAVVAWGVTKFWTTLIETIGKICLFSIGLLKDQSFIVFIKSCIVL